MSSPLLPSSDLLSWKVGPVGFILGSGIDPFVFTLDWPPAWYCWFGMIIVTGFCFLLCSSTLVFCFCYRALVRILWRSLLSKSYLLRLRRRENSGSFYITSCYISVQEQDKCEVLTFEIIAHVSRPWQNILGQIRTIICGVTKSGKSCLETFITGEMSSDWIFVWENWTRNLNINGTLPRNPFTN